MQTLIDEYRCSRKCRDLNGPAFLKMSPVSIFLVLVLKISRVRLRDAEEMKAFRFEAGTNFPTYPGRIVFPGQLANLGLSAERHGRARLHICRKILLDMSESCLTCPSILCTSELLHC